MKRKYFLFKNKHISHFALIKQSGDAYFYSSYGSSVIHCINEMKIIKKCNSSFSEYTVLMKSKDWVFLCEVEGNLTENKFVKLIPEYMI